MSRNLNSLLCGAVVAALVIAPTVPSFGKTPPAPPPAPSAPAKPAMPPKAPSVANPYWAVRPTQNFNAGNLKLDDIVGTLTIDVRNGGPMTIEVSGAPERVKGVRVWQEGSRLVVEGSSYTETFSVWDWRHWFDFADDEKYRNGKLFVRATIPRGSDVDVDGLVGDATIGDTMGPLHLDAAVSKMRIGKVSQADITVGGSGRIDITSVTNELELNIGGSGKVTTGAVGSLKADIAGAGDAQFGTIARGLQLDIAGSGDVTAAHVNGPTHIEIAGAGTVKIADGIADPFHVEIMGAGNCYFGGVAVNPHVEALGAGNVHIKAYRGHLDSEGMADVKIGD